MLVNSLCVGATRTARYALAGLRRMQQSPGCSARVSTRAPGLRPHGFWSRPGPSDWVSPALTFSEVFHHGLRQLVSTRPLGLAAGVHYGGLKPPLRSRPRQSGLLQNPRHPRQRCIAIAHTQEKRITKDRPPRKSKHRSIHHAEWSPS